MTTGLTLAIRNEIYNSQITEAESNLRASRTGYAFYCPACAVIWATGLVSGADTYPLVLECGCRRVFRRFPGSIWLSWDPGWNAALPLPVLIREIEIAIKEYEK